MSQGDHSIKSSERHCQLSSSLSRAEMCSQATRDTKPVYAPHGRALAEQSWGDVAMLIAVLIGDKWERLSQGRSREELAAGKVCHH